MARQNTRHTKTDGQLKVTVAFRYYYKRCNGSNIIKIFTAVVNYVRNNGMLIVAQSVFLSLPYREGGALGLLNLLFGPLNSYFTMHLCW